MAWFGSLPLAFGIYAPAAFAGLLLPYALLPSAGTKSGPGMPLHGHLLGAALAHAAAASAVTAAGAKSGFLFAAWALGALLAAVALKHPARTRPGPECG